MPTPEMFPEVMQGGETMQTPESIQGGTTPTPITQSTVPQVAPSAFEISPGSPTILDTEYTQGYLRTQVGKRIRVTFLIGTSTIQDREGILEKVGISYIILRETETNTSVLCDIYSIKFVNIFSK
jgi:hypothetical protein